MATSLRDFIATLPKEQQERIEKLSSNIFSEIGLDDAEELSRHGALGCLIIGEIRERNMKREEVSALLDLRQDEVDLLVNGHFDQFYANELTDFLSKLFGR